MTTPQYHSSGEIPISDDVIYVTRRIDAELREALTDTSSHLPVIYGCRQSGKTSLVFRLNKFLNELDGRSYFVDLRDVIPSEITEMDEFEFLKKICYTISLTLNKEEAYLAWCVSPLEKLEDRFLSTTQFFKHFVHEILLKGNDQKITIFFDEIDRVISFDRSWQFLLDASYDIANKSEFRNLQFVFVGLSRILDLATDADTPKFEHLRIFHVPDFEATSTDVVKEFARGLHHVEETGAREELTRLVLAHTNGQPFLTCRVLELIARRKIANVEECEEFIDLLIEGWGFGSKTSLVDRPVHFDQPLKVLVENYNSFGLQALIAYKNIYSGKGAGPLKEKVKAALTAAGLIVESNHNFQVRNKIYGLIFDRQWIDFARRSIIDSNDFVEKGYQSTRTAAGRKETLPTVLLLNLGGTLGMEVNNIGQLVEPDDPQGFFSSIPHLTEIINPIVETPIARPTDGANIVPSDWVSIAQTIHQYRNQNIDGVLVAAGTDTLAYTASAVAFALGQGLKFPVVFTGSQAPITKYWADSHANMLRAALVAGQGAVLPEVVIVFNDVAIRAVRTEKRDDYRFDAFSAPSQGPLAVIGERLQYQLTIRQTPSSSQRWDLAANFESRILKISQYPGMSADYIISVLKHNEIKGLLIESLGLGNVPVVEPFSLIPAIEYAVESSIPVLISGRYPIQTEFIQNYRPASLPLELGAISAGDMAPPAALTKFMWAIAQANALIGSDDLSKTNARDTVAKIMEENLLGEVGVISRGN